MTEADTDVRKESDPMTATNAVNEAAKKEITKSINAMATADTQLLDEILTLIKMRRRKSEKGAANQ
ncbi:MAG: hypothetical protein ACRDBO_04505 [Lachnospiraceae bacterium]